MADSRPRSDADVPRRNGRVVKEASQDVSFKVLMIGDSSVGKTATLGRFTEDNFPHSFISTVGRLGEGRGRECRLQWLLQRLQCVRVCCGPLMAVCMGSVWGGGDVVV